MKLCKLLFLKRLNLKSSDQQLTTESLSLFFQLMDEKQLHFEQTFFDFHSFNLDRLQKSTFAVKYCGPIFEQLKVNFLKMNVADVEKQESTYFKKMIPETLIIDEIESIWSAIENADDWSLFEKKLQSIREMGHLSR